MIKATVFIAILFAFTPSLAGEVVINEVMAKNDATAQDQNGEYNDWIELYNRSDQSVWLRGFFISDDYNNLKKWLIPDTVLSPRGFLIIWADDDLGQRGLHTNFKLSANGDVVYLANSNGEIVDRIAFGVQRADISLGRFPDGAGKWWRMQPSFFAPNRGTNLGLLDSSEVVFNPAVVHRIDLEFYTPNWQDLLRYNFETLDKEYAPVRVIFDQSVVLDSVGVRYKGNSSYVLSRHTPKKPFKLRFDKYKEGQMLFDLLKLNLSNGISDPTFMRETIAYSIARRYLPAPRTGFANLYVNGELIGFYVLAEQIDTQFLLRHFGDHTFNLYKATNTGATLLYRGADKSDYESELRLRTNRDDGDWGRLIEMLNKLNTTPRRAFLETMSQYLNLENCLRFLAFNMVLSNFDSYTGSGRNFYLYDDRTTGQFYIIPWDPNEAFGVFRNNWNVITQDIDVTSNIRQRPLIKKLLENDSLKWVYWDYIEQMSAGPAAYDTISAQAEQLRSLIEPYVRDDVNKLYNYQLFTNNIEGEVQLELGRTIPGLKSFSLARNASIVSQLGQVKVYPGDTDNNGVVNEFDILPIGVYFQTAGSPRLYTTYAFSPQRTDHWATIPATYADVNGDGRVDEKDIIGIGVNWNLTHRNAQNTFEIVPRDEHLKSAYKQGFLAMYNALSGDDASSKAIKRLLESLLDLSTSPSRVNLLYPNYPNPFNHHTTIRFYLAKEQEVSLEIISPLGQVISTPLVGQILKAGYQWCTIDGAYLPSGTYFYRLTTPTTTLVGTMMVDK